jgi:hypothetical protein
VGGSHWAKRCHRSSSLGHTPSAVRTGLDPVPQPAYPPAARLLGPRVKPGDDGGGAANCGRKACSRPKPCIRRDPDIAWHSPRGTRASARLRPGAGSPRLGRPSLADAIGFEPRPQRACPTAPFGTGGAAWPGAPTRLQPGGGRSVQPPPTPSGTEGPAAWPVRAGWEKRPAPHRLGPPAVVHPRFVLGRYPATRIPRSPPRQPFVATSRLAKGMRGRMGPNGEAGISFADRRGPLTLALSPKGRGDDGADGQASVKPRLFPVAPRS